VTTRAERASPARLAGLHVLADDDPRWGRDPVAQARAACRGGAAVVQLRCKHATDSDALAWAQCIRELTRTSNSLFIVNDRFDLALLADADGVHLGQGDVSPCRIPKPARDRLLIGRSTHSLEQARDACEEPVDYLAFGPIFGTRSKDSAHAPRGVERLRECARLVSPRPLVAIGGIAKQHVREVIAAGASAIAVISAVAAAEDMETATRALVVALRAGRAA
jgi:thiamine-phosphate pyrophosphorylase